MHFDLFDPVFDIVEGGSIIDCVGEDDAHGSFVVGLSDGLEPFLPGSIPYLEPNFFLIYFDCFDFEIDAWVMLSVPIVERCEVRKLF